MTRGARASRPSEAPLPRGTRACSCSRATCTSTGASWASICSAPMGFLPTRRAAYRTPSRRAARISSAPSTTPIPGCSASRRHASCLRTKRSTTRAGTTTASPPPCSSAVRSRRERPLARPPACLAAAPRSPARPPRRSLPSVPPRMLRIRPEPSPAPACPPRWWPARLRATRYARSRARSTTRSPGRLRAQNATRRPLRRSH